MGRLADQLQELVSQGRYIISVHASERLEERGILEWQVIEAMDRAALVTERPDALPNPAAEFDVLLPDGAEVRAVWSFVRALDIAKLVTVHYFDED